MRLVDAHCHLHDKMFDRDRDDVVERASKSDVVFMITSSLSRTDASKVLEIKTKYPSTVGVCIGSDPLNLNMKDVKRIRAFARKHKNTILGIGEVGLDYYWVRENEHRETQIRLFREWIRFAEELHLPLIVHSRSAGKYAVKILLESRFKRILMHAYDGRTGWAIKATEEGLRFSIPTSVWYSKQKQKLVKALPLNSLLVETDAPVLSPIRGNRNEPANLIYAIRKIAELKEVSDNEVAETTTRNAEELFQIPNRIPQG